MLVVFAGAVHAQKKVAGARTSKKQSSPITNTSIASGQDLSRDDIDVCRSFELKDSPKLRGLQLGMNIEDISRSFTLKTIPNRPEDMANVKRGQVEFADVVFDLIFESNILKEVMGNYQSAEMWDESLEFAMHLTKKFSLSKPWSPTSSKSDAEAKKAKIVEGNPVYQDLTKTRNEAVAKLEQLKKDYGDGHQKVRSQQKYIATLDKGLDVFAKYDPNNKDINPQVAPEIFLEFYVLCNTFTIYSGLRTSNMPAILLYRNKAEERKSKSFEP